MDYSWPADGFLVHPGFGLIPYQQQPLPLEERHLPVGFRDLDDRMQDERLDQVVRLVLSWAQACGAESAEAEVVRRDWPVAQAAGLHRTSGYRWVGDFDAEAISELLTANPERLWVRAGDELCVYMHEAWGSIVVRGGSAVIEQLRRDLQRLQESWD